MCVHPVSEWSVFFTLQCELFTSCIVSNSASLVSARTGGVVKKMWTGRGGSQKFQTLCGHPLWMTPYESSGSQFIRTNTGIQSGPEAFDESMLVMTFLTNLGITEICSFRLVLEEKASKEIPELSEFLEKFLENSFAFIEFRRQHWPLSRRVMADLPLWRTILAIPRKLR